MDDRDWLAGWNARYARLLIETEGPTVRAGLVDTNGDGHELWFGLDIRRPSGEWIDVLDWSDVGGHHPVGPLGPHADVLFGWGTGRPRERKVVDFDGHSYPLRVAKNGWWLVATAIPTQI